ncbi:MAG: discoidin domain-containing protein [Tannerella sp.]|jgi:hypothetical protein|nr:discoidin domain-containing protein [Tannerella sp.]
MKRYFYYIFTAGLIALMASCSDMNDDHDQYLRNGEIIYIGRLDSAYAYSGKGRFQLHYWLTDPRCKVLKIYRSQGADSLIVPIPAHTPLEPLDVFVDNVAEGSYTLQIYTSDGADLRSVRYETNVNVYGDKFASTITNRVVVGAIYQTDKSVVVTWGAATSVKEAGVELSYTSSTDKPVKTFYPTATTGLTTILSDIDVTKGLYCKTMYLPEPTSIDTFSTPSVKIPVYERSIVSLGSQTATSDFLSGYPGNLAVDGDKTSTPSRWVTDDTNNEHWLTLDLGAEYTVNAFETVSGAPAQANFSLQTLHDGQWVNVHTKTANAALTYYADFTPVKGQHFRYYIPAYAVNRVRLFEITLYATKEY